VGIQINHKKLRRLYALERLADPKAVSLPTGQVLPRRAQHNAGAPLARFVTAVHRIDGKIGRARQHGGNYGVVCGGQGSCGDGGNLGWRGVDEA
jgi:hypothetical protein